MFDGDRLLAKSERGSARDDKERRGETERTRAIGTRQSRRLTLMFTQSLDISAEMALELIVALKREGIEFVVAPYEADAQIAHLQRQSRENGGRDGSSRRIRIWSPTGARESLFQVRQVWGV